MMLKEIGVEFETPTMVHVDNQGTVKSANQDDFKLRNKTVGVKFHHVQEQVREKVIKVVHVATQNNPADLFTKPLSGKLFETFVAIVMGHKSHKELLDQE